MNFHREIARLEDQVSSQSDICAARFWRIPAAPLEAAPRFRALTPELDDTSSPVRQFLGERFTCG